MEMSFDTFKIMSSRKLKLDFFGYRDNQLQRRLNSFMQKRGFPDYLSLLKFLQEHPGEVDSLRDYVAINVSEFFRNADMFKYLAQHVFPSLNRHGMIKMWSAGCSVGCEAYTLGILAEEQHFRGEWSVLASDIDNAALDAAREGVYAPDLLKQMPEQYLNRYFIPAPGELHKVKDQLKKNVRFQKRDLFKDSYPKGMDLIACRNVVIYFTEEAKREIFSQLYASLRSGGVLFIGATEGFHNYQDFQLKRLHPCIYQRF